MTGVSSLAKIEENTERGHVMSTQKVKFSSQASPQTLAEMRELRAWLAGNVIARSEGRQFQAVLQEAMEEYIANRSRATPRPEVMAHFRASVEVGKGGRRYSATAGWLSYFLAE